VKIPWTGGEAYAKNVRVQMGRCPVRSLLPEAIRLLETKQDQLGFMFDKMMSLDDAAEGYRLFDEMGAQKVIFLP
jgi:threonine dehydrogenase-like Zn-dependent dehydrogenase